MRVLSTCIAFFLCPVGMTAVLAVDWSFRDTYYHDPAKIAVERDSEVVDRLNCERIRLDYPELAGRGEANTALDANGGIWAAVGYNKAAGGSQVKGTERLFHSRDGGRTWSSRTMSPTKDAHLQAFTVLKDGRMLLVTGDSIGHDHLDVFASKDQGRSWKKVSVIPAAPFQRIGEGFMSLTQLADGRVLFPVRRWIDPSERYVLDARVGQHYVYVSNDGGRTFSAAHSTFSRCGGEAHVIQLSSGNLLGAFRYQRPRDWDETPERLIALGADLEKDIAFKHVFLADSEDGGKTWTNLRPLRDAQGRALLRFGECHGQLVQVPDGRVVLVHGNRYPSEKGEVRARVSRDNGQTWEPEIYHVSFGRGYASSVALEDGTIVTVTGNVVSVPKRPPPPWPAQAIRWKLPEP